MKLLPEFPGIAVQQHNAMNPFWLLTLRENLTWLKATPTGKKLLKALGKCKPRFQGQGFLADAVVCIEESLIPAEIGLDRRQNESSDSRACQRSSAQHTSEGEPGEGTTSRIVWGSAGSIANDCSFVPGFIVLGHELIHSLHFAKGIALPGLEEEYLTVGCQSAPDWPDMDPYKPETLPELCENRIRIDAKFPVRTKY